MSRITTFSFALALPLTLVSHAALADLTPQQVWSDWRSYMEGVGYTVEATETVTGGDMTVSDISLSFASPDNKGTATMAIGAIAFQQNRDGTVAIVMPETMPMSITGSGGVAAGQDAKIEVIFTQTGHAMTVSGVPEEMVYDYTADSMKVDVDQAMSNAQQTGTDTAKMSFTGANITNKTTMTIGDMRGYEQSSSIATAAYELVINAPSSNGQMADVSGTVSGITVEGSGTIPLVMPDTTDLSEMLAEGFDVTGNIAYQNGTSSFDIQNTQDGSFKMQTTSQGGRLDVAMGATGLAYGGGQQQLQMALTADTVPFPVEFSMAETAFNLALPVTKADEAQDFALGFTLGDFTMSDMIWSIFDRTGQLPRDPATVKLDLTGKAKVLVDYLTPQNSANLTASPAAVEALKLNSLLIDAAGAKLEGSGDVTFDGSGPSMIPGMGSPVGAINIALAGGNGLLDKLTAMGLLPQQQAMGARMMMGLFTVPGDAPDTMKSKIDFTQDGQILANGQRIR